MSEGDPPPESGGAYDYRGRVYFDYSPVRDRLADPGEVAWSWVAYEEDDRVGKDRPVLIIGYAGRHHVAALMVTTRERPGDDRWVPIGSGTWDRTRRPSYARVDRVLRVRRDGVRRIGAVLPRATFDSVVRACRAQGVRRAGLIARVVQRLSRARADRAASRAT